LNYICTEKFGTFLTNTQQRILFYREWTDFRRAYFVSFEAKRIKLANDHIIFRSPRVNLVFGIKTFWRESGKMADERERKWNLFGV